MHYSPLRAHVLPHVHVAGVDDCTVMGNAVYDCLRNDVSAQTSVPLALLVLRAEDIVPAIKYFSKWEKYDMLRA